MTLPRSEFAVSYLAHVVPGLRKLATSLAVPVANSDTSFSEALSDLRREAGRLGAGYLPDAHYEALLDWTAATMLDAVVKAQAMAEEADAFVRTVLTEPTRAGMREKIGAFLHAG